MNLSKLLEQAIEKEVEKQLVNRAVASKSYVKAELSQHGGAIVEHFKELEAKIASQKKQINKLFSVIHLSQKEQEELNNIYHFEACYENDSATAYVRKLKAETWKEAMEEAISRESSSLSGYKLRKVSKI